MIRPTPVVDTVTLHLPFRHLKRGGRKEMQPPPAVLLQCRIKNTVAKALDRPCRWKRQIDERVYASRAEIPAGEKLRASYISRITRLALLAPDIIEAILAGTPNQNVILNRLKRACRPSGRRSGPVAATDPAREV